MTFDPKVIEALARVRLYAAGQRRDIQQELNILDNAGVFAALDEQTGYAAAEDILADTTGYDITPVDPAEWGDTTRADMARHQGYEAASRLGSLERVPGTDRLVPARERDAEELDAGDRKAVSRLGRRAFGLE